MNSQTEQDYDKELFLAGCSLDSSCIWHNMTWFVVILYTAARVKSAWPYRKFLQIDFLWNKHWIIIPECAEVRWRKCTNLQSKTWMTLPVAWGLPFLVPILVYKITGAHMGRQLTLSRKHPQQTYKPGYPSFSVLLTALTGNCIQHIINGVRSHEIFHVKQNTYPNNSRRLSECEKSCASLERLLVSSLPVPNPFALMIQARSSGK